MLGQTSASDALDEMGADSSGSQPLRKGPELASQPQPRTFPHLSSESQSPALSPTHSVTYTCLL